MTIEINFSLPDLARKLDEGMGYVMNETLVAMQTNRGMMFDAEGAHNGHPKWAPLKFRNGQILSDHGVLRASFAPKRPTGRPGPDGIADAKSGVLTVGTSLKKATILNFGGVIRAKPGHALAIPVPQGRGATEGARSLAKGAKSAMRKNLKKHTGASTQEISQHIKAQGGMIFRMSVTIPARPFDEINENDRLEFESAQSNAVREVLAR